MWALHHCFSSRRLQSVVVVVHDDGDDDVGFGSRWGLGAKGEKMGFGDVEEVEFRIVNFQCKLSLLCLTFNSLRGFFLFFNPRQN